MFEDHNGGQRGWISVHKREQCEQRGGEGDSGRPCSLRRRIWAFTLSLIGRHWIDMI